MNVFLLQRVFSMLSQRNTFVFLLF
jgi:hypothetical protein